MIDWANLAANALWIVGCAIALATISYASWEASEVKDKFIDRLKKNSYQIALNLAGFLFSAGLAWTSDTTLEIVLWAILTVAFFAQMVAAYWRKRNEVSTDTPK